MDDKSPVPLDAFFGTDHRTPNPEWPVVKTLTAAKVVIGVDVMSGHEFILFGREELKRFAGSEDGESLPALYIGLDQDTDELEKACAMMLAVKGRCDYIGSEV